ncbi:hypothetical protein [Pseudomonas xantholysinigenes]|uniref:Uncharacterized protein n=1 Tax=Pseudomonas xantholysinigenes TaxID=2745490 RepID=A0A9E6TZT9_9PSED|nr:hypothetical protein [Pseudomonas xantholysinigenes]QXI40416.1 hypothetical protein HU772_010230 [Pseudomonas xantholysinigenes]
MADEKIDAGTAYEIASWALGEAKAANDLLALVVGALVKTQPAAAADLRKSLKALLSSREHGLGEEFEGSAKRLCHILDGSDDQDTFESIAPYISTRDVERLKQRMFSPRGGNDPKSS